MFEYIKGKITVKKPEYVGVEVNDIAYKIYISLKTYDKLEEEVKLYIYSHIREDSFKLIGFYSENERDIFEKLLSVNGIGVSLALAILSTFEIANLKQVILNENIKLLTKVPKLGKKKAEKLIVDLRDKIGNVSLFDEQDTESDIEEELYMALQALGYSKKDISKLVTKKDIANYSSIEMAVKDVLKKNKFIEEDVYGKEKGFTLIEIMIVVAVILLVVVYGVLNLRERIIQNEISEMKVKVVEIYRLGAENSYEDGFAWKIENKDGYLELYGPDDLSNETTAISYLATPTERLKLSSKIEYKVGTDTYIPPSTTNKNILELTFTNSGNIDATREIILKRKDGGDVFKIKLTKGVDRFVDFVHIETEDL